MKIKIIFINTISLFCVYFSCGYALAGCTSPTNFYNATMSTPTISAPQNRAVGPVGGVITLGDGILTTVRCDRPMNYMLKFSTPMTESSIPGVYNTNVPGIGIKVWDSYYEGGIVNIKNEPSFWYIPGGNQYTSGAYLTLVNIQFYITGPFSAGTVILPSPFVESWVNERASGLSLVGGSRYNAVQVTTNVNVIAGTCETPDMTVPLGERAATEFSGPGTTSQAKKFNFSLKNCAAGMNTVSYKFEPAAGVKLMGSGNNQYLTLDSTSTAKGVGVQVLYDDNSMVPFNSKIKYTGYTGAGSYVIPMKARYLQTGNIIVGGTANSALEFTMTYE